MHDQPIPTIIPAEPDTTPDLTPAIALLRKLFAAGWKADHSYEIADDATVYGLIHPSGREASAVVYPDGQHTVTLSGLDLGQVVGAVTGAGLAPDSVQPACLNLLTPGHGCTGTPEPGGLHCADCIKADWWLSLAADLRTIAERAAALAGTDTPPVFGPYLGIYTSYVESDADRAVPVVDALAAAFGTTALTQTEGRGTTGAPSGR
ncbi:hypothetical protein GA0074692_6834 [Micromonospora pallida]|uniref:Uncharacterized protein n=1 Tax=Micromonospora pallida TaxID=145854 RepID=A0A1C6TP30_9ACTN|nr:hypothetical protein [Micromonospora pallida]SCL43347.1 hypothetical protein GA0074692_6834 [Micromonospora pallida]